MIEWSLFKHHIFCLMNWDDYQTALKIMRVSRKPEYSNVKGVFITRNGASRCTRRESW